MYNLNKNLVYEFDFRNTFQFSSIPAGTIVRDPHHHKCPDTLQTGFKPMQNLSSGFVK